MNDAVAALMPERGDPHDHEYFEVESRIGGYEAEVPTATTSGAYESVAQLVGKKVANVAFTYNATAWFTQALSSVRFERGDAVLTTRNNF